MGYDCVYERRCLPGAQPTNWSGTAPACGLVFAGFYSLPRVMLADMGSGAPPGVVC